MRYWTNLKVNDNKQPTQDYQEMRIEAHAAHQIQMNIK